jgi:polysaccharide export outer membrane protein
MFSNQAISLTLRVDPSGRLTLPVGGQLLVSGMTAAEASKAIEQLLYSSQIVLDPHVSILVTQYATQGVTILGEVRTPGIYPVRGSSTLYDALSMAGGPSATEGAEITIAHRGEADHPLLIRVKSSDYSSKQQITPIRPGDTVVVSRAPVIYVVGDVKSPGLFPMPYGKPLSVLNVLALTQGFNSTASTKKASIVRVTSGNTAETISLDLDKIMKNEAPTVELEASDVLVIPRSGSKTFWQYALPALTNAAATGAISIALYK